MENNTKTFINGLISKPVSPNAPEWILGTLSINVESLTNWLNTTGKQVQSNGWINLNIKKSKEGKRYIEVDTYKPQPMSTPPPKKAYEVPTVQLDLPNTGEATPEELNSLNDTNSLNINGKRVAVDVTDEELPPF